MGYYNFCSYLYRAELLGDNRDQAAEYTCFADPDDLIPDRVPGLGYLDDAIMVELVVQDLKHEIEAFDAFCDYRKANKKAKDDGAGLEKRRASLQGRMRRRRRADRDRHARRAGKSPISLW